jgi:putative transposase
VDSASEVLLDLAQAQQRESARRKALLGVLAGGPYDHLAFQKRARATDIPIEIYRQWHIALQQNGMDGLRPKHWQALDEASAKAALERYKQLLPYADMEFITEKDIASLADIRDWSFRSAQRWLRRYRIGGLWGLTPEYNPIDGKSGKQRNVELPPDLGALDDSALQEIFRRRDLLGELADRDSVPNAELAARATQVGISVRQLRYYHTAYRKHGLAGLAPRRRSDKGKMHNLSERMVQLVQDLRLTNKDLPIHALYKSAFEKAVELGETPPTQWQVRKICESIPAPVKLIADKRYDEFRNKYRFTFGITFSGIVYQIDHTVVDVLVVDNRQRSSRSKSGEVRPYLMIVIDSKSHCVIAYSLEYDRPDSYTVGDVIHASLTSSPGGVPGEIWVDNGKEFVSALIRNVTREYDIKLHPCAPHEPQLRGIVERMFGTLNTRLWSTLPGYIGSNVQQRNPSAKATLTIDELEQHLVEFLKIYHQEIHDVIGMSPLSYWHEHCHALPPNYIRPLDLFLSIAVWRKVLKNGLKYGGRRYIDKALGQLVGNSVLIRANTRHGVPDHVEVYHEDRWVCRAWAVDSDHVESLAPEQLKLGQTMQKQLIRTTIKHAKARIAQLDEQDAKPPAQQVAQGTPMDTPQPAPLANKKTLRQGEISRPLRAKDIFDRLDEELPSA